MLVNATSLEAIRTNFKREFEQSKAKANSRWGTVATRVTSTSRSNTYGWLGQFPQFREWVGPRQAKSITESGYVIENKDWETTVDVDRNDIEDDNLGVYMPLLQEMGYAAEVYPDELVFPILKSGTTTACYDGQNFFDAEHPIYSKVDGGGAPTSVSNFQAGDEAEWYLLDTRRALKPIIFQDRKSPEFVAKIDPRTSDRVFSEKTFSFGVDARSNVGFGFWQQAYASRQPLNSETLDEGIRRMMEFKADGGRPLGINPNVLIVSPANRSAANKTVKAMLGEGGATNPNYGAVDVEVIEWLA